MAPVNPSDIRNPGNIVAIWKGLIVGSIKRPSMACAKRTYRGRIAPIVIVHPEEFRVRSIISPLPIYVPSFCGQSNIA